jgi:hypothetical protein
VDMRVRLERANARVQYITADITNNKVSADLMEKKMSISDTEHELRELYSDPTLNLPHESAKRRQVARLEKRLKQLRGTLASEAELKERLDAVAGVNEQLCTAAAEGHLEAVRLLLQRGIPVNVMDRLGFNPLYYACAGGHLDVGMLLIEKGADLTDEDGKDKPLVVAARNGHLEVVSYLIESGAPVDGAEMESEKTALHVATEQGHEALVEHLLNCGANVNKVDRMGNTPLHIAARTPHVTIAVLLIDRGADLQARNAKYLTPMQQADDCRNYSFVSIISKYLGQEVGLTNPTPYSLDYNPLDPSATLTKPNKSRQSTASTASSVSTRSGGDGRKEGLAARGKSSRGRSGQEGKGPLTSIVSLPDGLAENDGDGEESRAWEVPVDEAPGIIVTPSMESEAIGGPAALPLSTE